MDRCRRPAQPATTLARKLRQEIEPVDADALGRFVVSWHGIGSGRVGSNRCSTRSSSCRGAAMPASMVEREILPARVNDFQPAMLDTLMAAGEVVWVGSRPLGERDGRIALYLTDHLPAPAPPAGDAEPRGTRRRCHVVPARTRRVVLQRHPDGTGGGFPNETVDALWELVWKGLITNDTLHPLRAYVKAPDKRAARRGRATPFRSRRLVPPTAEGRWSLVATTRPTKTSSTEWGAADGATTPLAPRHRHTRDRPRRGRDWRVLTGLPGAQGDGGYRTDSSRLLRRRPWRGPVRHAGRARSAPLDAGIARRARTAVLAATDPANPYGAIVKWPEIPQLEERGPTRTVGARVILVDGLAAAYVRRASANFCCFCRRPSRDAPASPREVVRMLLHLAGSRDEGLRGMLIAEINGAPATAHPVARIFIEEGFSSTALGLQARVPAGTRIAGASSRRHNHGSAATQKRPDRNT
jgi:ATP-dependent Lhr-like helicase